SSCRGAKSASAVSALSGTISSKVSGTGGAGEAPGGGPGPESSGLCHDPWVGCCTRSSLSFSRRGSFLRWALQSKVAQTPHQRQGSGGTIGQGSVAGLSLVGAGAAWPAQGRDAPDARHKQAQVTAPSGGSPPGESRRYYYP